jgi:DNA-3-methyladenine glycosylase II
MNAPLSQGRQQENSTQSMSHYLHTEADLDAALAKLVLADPRLAPVATKAGRFPLRRREGGFAGLCAIVIGQQLSVARAAAISGRMMAAFDPFHHDAVRRARTDKLQRIGLSAAKIRTLKAIGKAVSSGDINLEALVHMDADDAHNALIKLHGIGPWTADIYLMVCLGHADAWPAGDLALQEAARHALNLRSRPDANKMIKLAEIWRPYRAVAAHLLWKYYGVIKGREGAPIATTEAKPANNKSTKEKEDTNVRSRRPAARAARR